MGVGSTNPTHILKAEKLWQELFGFVLSDLKRGLTGGRGLSFSMKVRD